MKRVIVSCLLVAAVAVALVSAQAPGRQAAGVGHRHVRRSTSRCARRTTSSATSTAAGSTRRRSPPTRPSYGSFDIALRQDRGGPARHRRGGRQGRRRARARTPGRSATSTRASWTRPRVESLGLDAAGRGTRGDRRHQDEGRSRAGVRPHAEARLRCAARRRSPKGDFKDPKTTALFVYQSGLGLPDRDYYTKDDAKLAEYRTKYVTFLAAMHKLGGLPAPGRGGRRHHGDRDAPGEEPVDQRRNARHGEDVQQGRDRRPRDASSPASTGPRGRPS